MQRKLMLFTAIFTFLFMSSIVNAESYVAEVNGNKYQTIEAAMTAAEGTNNEVKLLDNVTLSATKRVEKDLTINLNGFKITKNNKLFEVRGATFTVTGEGTLEETIPDYAPILIYGAENDIANYTVVNVGEGVLLKGWSGIMIRELSAYNSKYKKTSYGVVVNFNGKTETFLDTGDSTGSGIYINGWIKNNGNIPTINIGSTAVINSIGAGVYAAGNGKWNIDGASITGVEMGIAAKAGEINVKNSIVKATGVHVRPVEGVAGAINPSGAAVQIESNSNYYGEIILNFENTKFISEQSAGIYEYLGNNNETDTKVNSVKINNCEYDVEKEDIYVSDKYKTKFTRNITLEKVENGKIAISKTSAVIGEKISLSTTANEGYEQNKITVTDSKGNEIKVKDNSFYMVDTDVKVKVEFIKVEVITSLPTVDLDKKVETVEIGISDTKEIQNILLEEVKNNSNFGTIAEDVAVEVKVKVDNIKIEELDEKTMTSIKEAAGNKKVSNIFDISINVIETTSRKELGKLEELKNEIEFKLLLPEEMKNKDNKMQRDYYIIREHNGKIDTFKAELSKDGNYLTFKTNKFSVYALAYEDNVKTNPKTGDKLFINFVVGTLSIASLCGTAYYIKSKKIFN